MRLRHFSRLAVTAVTATTAVALASAPAHAAAATFVGNSFSDCTRPAPPSFGTSSGSGSCFVEAASWSCTTAVDIGEVAVAAPCTADLVGTTSLFFVQVRLDQSGPVQVFCYGTGNGTFTYRATPSSPPQNIPVTITVEGGVGTFTGVAVFGLEARAVEGTFSGACGGSGNFAGEVA